MACRCTKNDKTGKIHQCFTCLRKDYTSRTGHKAYLYILLQTALCSLITFNVVEMCTFKNVLCFLQYLPLLENITGNFFVCFVSLKEINKMAWAQESLIQLLIDLEK